MFVCLDAWFSTHIMGKNSYLYVSCIIPQLHAVVPGNVDSSSEGAAGAGRCYSKML